MAPLAPQVFISYSHDSALHREGVLALADRLNRDGLDCHLDRYIEGQPPPDWRGWPHWMRQMLEQADFVLVVCTEIYRRRYEGKEVPGRGLGGSWEGAIITQAIYEAHLRNTKFIPVIFDPVDAAQIPIELRAFDHYLLEQDYDKLYRLLTAQPEIDKPPTGQIRVLPRRRRNPDPAALTEAAQNPRSAARPENEPVPANPPRRAHPGAGKDQSPHRPGPLFYALVSLVAFLIGFLILSVMLWNAPLLVSLGLTGNFYYVLLLALDLSAAAFLFGLLQSHAVYRGHAGWGGLELGVAIVGCALVVIGGFYFVPNSLPFAISIFVHGQEGSHDLVPQGSGDVVMELGPEVRRQQIGPNGTVYFNNIAPTYRGREVPVWVESKQFESVHPDQKYPLKGDAIQLEVRKKAGKLSGRVEDAAGKPLAGAKVAVAGLSVTTDAVGHFALAIPGDAVRPELTLEAEAVGYARARLTVVPDSNDVVVQLNRAP
jgi:hypothetical protein